MTGAMGAEVSFVLVVTPSSPPEPNEIDEHELNTMRIKEFNDLGTNGSLQMLSVKNARHLVMNNILRMIFVKR